MRRSLLLSVVLVACFSCSRPLPELNDIDLDKWKSDFKGCHGNRKQFLEPLRTQRDKLKGLSEMDLVKLLGKPDRNDLSERNEKFYYFYIDPGEECGSQYTPGLTLIVRFNATGVSREAVIE